MTNIKLGTFAFAPGDVQTGVLVGEDKVVKLAEAYAAYAAEKKPALANLPTDMVEMMKLGQAGADAARAQGKQAGSRLDRVAGRYLFCRRLHRAQGIANTCHQVKEKPQRQEFFLCFL